jgi:hypothetical protein
LERACRSLDGSRALVIALVEGRIPEIVLHLIERRLTVADAVALERLRKTTSDDPPATLMAKAPQSLFGGGAAGDASPHGGTGKMPIGILKAP